MIDRSIRPLFSQNYGTETQIVCNLLSFAGKDSPDVLCINTVSYALYNTKLEWNGPIGCVRVGMIDDQFVINPSRKQLEKSPINLVLTVGPNKNIVMIEGWGDNLNQAKYISAIEFGTEKAYEIVNAIREMSPKEKNDENLEKITEIKKEISENSASKLEMEKKKNFINDQFQELAYSKLYDIFTNYDHDKRSRDEAVSDLRNAILNGTKSLKSLKSELITYEFMSDLFTKFVKKVVRRLVLEENKRVDGRSLDEIRPISCKVNLYNSLHGSALFQRGQTQVLSSITFDSLDSMYKMDSIVNMISPSITVYKNFMLHYEFPSFATNEISKIGGRVDRREIGHGALAEKSVYPLFPSDFDFTVRALCEVLESNGSSSMASVCATSMALMDAGVPINEPVCGVAMGIITDLDDKNNLRDYKILTDISGLEDFMGDTDFKIAGTKNGICALQADFKINGLPFNVIKELVEKSQSARSKIIDIMNLTISKSRENNKANKPVGKSIKVEPGQRGKLIGVGGLNLKRIFTRTGVSITPVDETNFSIFAPNQAALAEAEEMITSFINQQKEPALDFGGVYKAKVIEIVAGGLMVELYPGMKPTLLPNSQLEGRKIVHGSVSEFKVGQEILVKYFGRDPIDGKMRISRKALFKTSSPAQDLINKKN